MKNERKFLGYYNYTVVLTYMSMVIGYIGAVSALKGKITTAVISLLVTGLFDMFDGAIASTMKRTEDEKCFGIQIDSFSDFICFGVLPASIAYEMNDGSLFALCLAAMYVLASLIRLGYFNVDEQKRQKVSTGSRKVFYGMPVTTSALILPIVYAFIQQGLIPSGISMMLTLIVMGVCFLLYVPVKKAQIRGKIIIVLWGVGEVGLLALCCAV